MVVYFYRMCNEYFFNFQKRSNGFAVHLIRRTVKISPEVLDELLNKRRRTDFIL